MSRGAYILMDSKSVPLAHGRIENSPDAEEVHVKVFDNKIDEVLKHQLIQLVGMIDSMQSILGRIVGSRNDVIILRKQKMLGEDVRQNLRIPVSFDTYIYPLSGSWVGRRRVELCDLSCGGIALYSEEPFEESEQFELVLPVTSRPLILKCQILRQRSSPTKALLYAAKFVDLCHDEETMIRETVFSIQIEQKAK